MAAQAARKYPTRVRKLRSADPASSQTLGKYLRIPRNMLPEALFRRSAPPAGSQNQTSVAQFGTMLAPNRHSCPMLPNILPKFANFGRAGGTFLPKCPGEGFF